MEEDVDSEEEEVVEEEDEEVVDDGQEEEEASRGSKPAMPHATKRGKRRGTAGASGGLEGMEIDDAGGGDGSVKRGRPGRTRATGGGKANGASTAAAAARGKMGRVKKGSDAFMSAAGGGKDEGEDEAPEFWVPDEFAGEEGAAAGRGDKAADQQDGEETRSAGGRRAARAGAGKVQQKQRAVKPNATAAASYGG
jgi:hypothetical protein